MKALFSLLRPDNKLNIMDSQELLIINYKIFNTLNSATPNSGVGRLQEDGLWYLKLKSILQIKWVAELTIEKK